METSEDVAFLFEEVSRISDPTLLPVTEETDSFAVSLRLSTKQRGQVYTLSVYVSLSLSLLAFVVVDVRT